MRRRITLYIGGTAVDLSDDSFILFNWAFEDLSNPTVVKNSWSQQVTLPGTDNNNAIFGQCFRPDHRVGSGDGLTGADFNPLRRTPFTIFSETNEVLQEGYVRLDSVSRKGKWIVSWTVTLYGGLGSFLYSLSYDDEGNKRTLADLDYLGTSDPDGELDFVITADTVRKAWDADMNGGSVDGKWKVVNFAPCYNGIPGGEFSADKGLGMPSEFGLENRVVDGDEIYDIGNTNGTALFNLAEEVDEWAVKDLRSYLQRPVFALRALFAAVSEPGQNGGYDVDLSALTASSFPYSRLWMTLPMLPSLSLDIPDSIRISPYGMITGNREVARFNITGLPSGVVLDMSLNFQLDAVLNSSVTQDTLYLYSAQTVMGEGRLSTTYRRTAVLFIQLVAYDSNGNMLAGTPVKAVYNYSGTISAIRTPAGMAEQLSYYAPYVPDDQPDGSHGVFEAAPLNAVWNKGTGYYRLASLLSFSLSGVRNCSYVAVNVTAYQLGTSQVYGASETFDDNSGGNRSTPTLYTAFNDISTGVSASAMQAVSGSGTSEAEVTGAPLRSGATVTKRILLSTESTPADYLLGFCKMFGFVLVYDNAARKVTAMRREDFFNTGLETIDLTERIDTSREVVIEPFAFTAKWYEMALEGSGTAFEDAYANIYGRDYGSQRINTGYDFDSETVDLLEGIPFRSAPGILLHSRYLNHITVGGQFRPSPFVDKGNTYTLWNDSGDTKDVDISCPPTNASVGYYNSRRGYDRQYAAKVQLYDSDGAAVDGQGVLLMRKGTANYPYFKLTDDTPEMDLLNEGRACWLLEPGTAAGVTVPVFSRYLYGSQITRSLDLGAPSEVDIPGVEYGEDAAIYPQAWRAYLRDRYDVNSKVMRCRVDLSGLQVGQELLRRFFWYQGALWVLNSIGNYSMTTWDFAECEFVQVQDKEAYVGKAYVGKDVWITVSDTVLTVPAAGGSVSFTVNSNDDFYIS